MIKRSIDCDRIDHLLRWMADGALPSASARTIIDRVCDELCGAGVPIVRMALFIFTLHPNIGGRRFVWEKGGKTEMTEAPHEIILSPLVQESPALAVMNSGKAMRQRLSADQRPFAFNDHEDLFNAGMTDTLLQPLPFTTGGIYASSWTTSAEGGFSDADIETLDRVRPLLARLTETYVLRLNAANLLTAYVGRDGGERILAGHIKQGDTEMIEAVILFADFKGFTRLSTTVEGAVVIDTLNRFFEIFVAAIAGEGGEVLKFLGDGLLAIFPLEKAQNAAVVVASARAAVAEATRDLRAANSEQPTAPRLEFRAAICLGDIHFGNIGGGGRLDFTAIGPSVNLAARLLGVATETGHDVVCSQAVADQFADSRSLGAFPLKGIAEPQAVFALPNAA